jgi:predicted nucleic acid-binding protein
MTLVDAGLLVALLDVRDTFHEACRDALRDKIREPMSTVWPAFTEAMYLLRGYPDAQEKLWLMLEKGAFQILPLDAADAPRMRTLMTKYKDLPMDLADAALVAVAERQGLDRIFTVDRKDFAVYRIAGKRSFKILP